MFLTSHTAAAILIATKIQNPYLGFLLGLLSHFILDIVPHGEGGLFAGNKSHSQKLVSLAKLAAVDFLLSIILLVFTLYFLQPNNNFIFIATMSGAVLPDFLWGSIELFKLKFLNWFLVLHHRLHDLLDIVYDIKYGLLVQAIFIACCLYLVFN